MNPIKIKDHFDLYKLLKINKIQLNFKDKYRNSILHNYVSFGDFGSTQIILEEFHKYKLPIDDKNLAGLTPRDIARNNGFLDIYILLKTKNLSIFKIKDCFLSFFKNQEKYGQEGNNLLLTKIHNNHISKKTTINHFRSAKQYFLISELEKENIHFTTPTETQKKRFSKFSLKEFYWILAVLSDITNPKKRFFKEYSWKELNTKKRYTFSNSQFSFNENESLKISKYCLDNGISMNAFFATILNQVLKKNLLNNNPDTIWLFSTKQSNNKYITTPDNYHTHSFMPVILNNKNHFKEVQQMENYSYDKKMFNFIEWYMKLFNFIIYFKPFKMDFFKKHLNQEKCFFGMIHDLGFYNIESEDKFFINNSPTSYYKTTCTFANINSEINVKIDIHESVCSEKQQKEIFEKFILQVKNQLNK